MRRAQGRKPSRAIVMAVALPPPTNGQAIINAAIARRFAGSDNFLSVVNISPLGQCKGVRYHLTRVVRVARALAELAWVGRRRQVRILYAVVESGMGIIYNLALVAFARLLRYEIYLHHHTSAHTLAFRGAFSLLAHVAGPGALHVALSSEMARDLVRYLSVRRVIVAHNACHVEDPGVSEVRRIDRRPFRLGLLSNLSLEKGLRAAIEATTAARRAGAEVELVLAGPLLDAQSVSLVEGSYADLGPALSVCGSVAGAAKDQFYRSIDAFVFPTRYRFEAQPLVIIEAMSYGLPVVTMDVGYIEELVGVSGVVASNEEMFAEMVVRCVKTWMNDQGAYSEASRSARARYEKLCGEAMLDLSNLRLCIESPWPVAVAAEDQTQKGTVFGLAKRPGSSHGSGGLPGFGLSRTSLNGIEPGRPGL